MNNPTQNYKAIKTECKAAFKSFMSLKTREAKDHYQNLRALRIELGEESLKYERMLSNEKHLKLNPVK